MTISLLQKINNHGLAGTVACLKDMPPMEGTSNPTNHTFPHNIPQCTIGEEELKGDYSLSATAPHLCGDGTKWALQLASLEKAKNGKCLACFHCLITLLPLLAYLACLLPYIVAFQTTCLLSIMMQTHPSPAMARSPKSVRPACS
jgi:hypothetical protein